MLVLRIWKLYVKFLRSVNLFLAIGKTCKCQVRGARVPGSKFAPGGPLCFSILLVENYLAPNFEEQEAN